MASRAYGGGSASGTSYREGFEWQENAACSSASPEEQTIMTGGAGSNQHNVVPAQKMARKYCDNCPVRTACFTWAGTEQLFMGVAGGYLWGFNNGKHYRGPEHRRLVRL